MSKEKDEFLTSKECDNLIEDNKKVNEYADDVVVIRKDIYSILKITEKRYYGLTTKQKG